MLGINDRQSIRERVAPTPAPARGAAPQQPPAASATAAPPAAATPPQERDAERAEQDQPSIAQRRNRRRVPRASPAPTSFVRRNGPSSIPSASTTPYCAEEPRRAGVLGRPRRCAARVLRPATCSTLNELFAAGRRGGHRLHRRVGRLRRRGGALHCCKGPTEGQIRRLRTSDPACTSRGRRAGWRIISKREIHRVSSQWPRPPWRCRRARPQPAPRPPLGRAGRRQAAGRGR